MCGGTPSTLSAMGSPPGLSPRVRGNLQIGQKLVSKSGSIPACAGEPRTQGRSARSPKVYPRVCGGTPSTCTGVAIVRGLSPRVRGNLTLSVASRVINGSIPACAGEPAGSPPMSSSTGVYPRVCGGTPRLLLLVIVVVGLSPRVRGNRSVVRPAVIPSRSIPACAGEPSRWSRWSATC